MGLYIAIACTFFGMFFAVAAFMAGSAGAPQHIVLRFIYGCMVFCAIGVDTFITDNVSVSDAVLLMGLYAVCTTLVSPLLKLQKEAAGRFLTFGAACILLHLAMRLFA